MNVNLGILGVLNRIVLILLAFTGLVFSALQFIPNFQQMERMHRRVQQLDARIQQEEEQGRQHEAATKALRNDPRTVERLARERLGYAKPGQTVIRFESPRDVILLPK